MQKYDNYYIYGLTWSLPVISDSNGKALIYFMGDSVPTRKQISLSEMAYQSEELKHLFFALSVFFPMIIYVNLTRNTYKIMEYKNFSTKKADVSGVFDDLISVGMSTVDPLHKQLFLDVFSRESLLKAYAQGETSVVLDVRQLGDDGVYRWVKTSVIFLKNDENDDVIEITLSRPITAEKSREFDNLRLRSILEMVMLSKYDYVSLVDLKTGRFTLYADSDRNVLNIPSSGDYEKWRVAIGDTFVSASDRDEYLERTALENLTARLKESGGNYSTRIRLGDTPERHWREVMYQICATCEDEMLMTVRDIHDEVTAAEMMKENEQRQILHGLGSDAPIGIITCDISGNITYANEKSAEILGSPGIAETMKINLLTFPLLVESGYSGKLAECLKENKSIVSEINYTSKWGKKVYLRVHIKSCMEHRTIIGAQVIIDDISEIKHLEEELRKASITDFLTNAYNRRYFLSQLENEIERTKRQGSEFSLIMFDLDHFKKVNDVYGHHAGDIILRSVADVVKKSIRKIDCLARWGGEEFVILIPGTAAAQARTLAERLRRKIGEINIQEIGAVTASFGVTQFSGSDTVDTLIQKADELTYIAKARGRNQVAF